MGSSDNECVQRREFDDLKNGHLELLKDHQEERVKNAEQRVLVLTMNEKLDDMCSDMKAGFKAISAEFVTLRKSETDMKIKLGVAMFVVGIIASIATTVVARAISLK